jgi:putative endopeptidase
MIKNWKKPAGLLIIGLATAGTISMTACKNSKTENEAAHKSIDVKNLDTTVSADADFFHYANGGWIKQNPIPETESRWGSFNELRDKNREILKKILDEASGDKNASKGSSKQLIGDFYFSGMDSARIEKEGLNPLKADLDNISAIKDVNGIVDEVASLHRYGIYPFFGMYIDQDAKKSTEYATYISQAGLGLPDRDYYTKTDKASEEIRAKYLAHVTKMFQLMGEDEATAAKDAKAVMNIETKLAGASMTRVESRDPYATYNKMAVSELAKTVPAINWNNYLAKVGIKQNLDSVIVSQPKFVKEVNSLLTNPDVESVKAYLRWHLVHSMAPYLSSNFVNENFAFNGTVLNGVKALEPRWKRVLDNTNGNLGEALGQEYVKVAFTPEAKAKALEMVNNLKAALKDKINGLDWMSEGTKKQAQNKLATMVTKIGYPDKWKTFDGLEIDRNSYAKNVMNASAYEFQRMINKLGKPIDRTEWLMTPPTVNAYYNPAMNEIVFPAGILQPPFFDANADDAVNYGGMGAVIGHELTHGFDDQGRQFDAQGNLKDWWTKEDAEKFKNKAQVVVKQFNGYQPIPGENVNGSLTLGENIADLGGLTISYAAWQKSQEGKKTTEKIDGLTPEQRFFLGWAQVWRVNERPESTKQRLITDPHSPAMFRVNGPLSNMPEFYKAFNIKPGAKMMTPDTLRASIW